MECVPGGLGKLTMSSKTLWHGLGAPERAIMVPPSLGMVFKGMVMEEQELCPCPSLQMEVGWWNSVQEYLR